MSATVAPSDRVDDRRRLLDLRRAIALSAAPILLLVGAGSHRWTSDDGFINFRIVDQLFAGHGFVFNASERVEAGTSPLWLGLLAVGRALAGRWADLGWIAVVLGIAGGVFGVVAAQLGAIALVPPGRRGTLVPLGAAVVAASPLVWDFATAGLESGLSFAWLGASWWVLARRAADRSHPSAMRGIAALLLIGLGPLVRPELAVATLSFGIAWILLSADGWARRAGAVAVIAAPASVYEVFRMGYFATLVPNAALAKEASKPEWARGLAYLVDFGWSTLILVPGAVVVAAIVRELTSADQPDRRARVATQAAIATAVVHVVYVVAVGGDFMRGRMVLVPLFTLVLPVAVVVADLGDRRVRALAVGVVAWCVMSMVVLPSVHRGSVSARGVGDERDHWVQVAGVANPVTADDYGASPYVTLGREWAARAERGDDVLIVNDGSTWPLPEGSGVRAAYGSVGLLGFVAGPDVEIVDRLGLGDPIAARLEPPSGPTRAGHEKALTDDWLFARNGPPGEGPAPVATAREVLACGELAALQRAIAEPVTPRRFVDNLFGAAGFTRLRIPIDPADAHQRFCS